MGRLIRRLNCWIFGHRFPVLWLSANTPTKFTVFCQSCNKRCDVDYEGKGICWLTDRATVRWLL
jgi:uncharacterized Fe-S radical SAM superfamily protein PflX